MRVNEKLGELISRVVKDGVEVKAQISRKIVTLLTKGRVYAIKFSNSSYKQINEKTQKRWKEKELANLSLALFVSWKLLAVYYNIQFW